MAIIDLKNLKPNVVSKDLKGKYVLLYGAPKVGKTTFASNFPKNLLIAFEPGYNLLSNKMVQPVDKWSDFKQVIRQLADDDIKETFYTITIDTCDIAWSLCEKYICQQNPNSEGIIPKTLGDIPYGRGFDLCKKEYDECFRQIASYGYGLVFISHEQQKTLKNEAGEEYVKIMPTLPDRPRLIVNRLVDIIAYIRNVRVSETETKRFLFMREDTTLYEAGSRFRYLPDRIELDYDKLCNAIYEAIDRQVKEDGGETTNDFVGPVKPEVRRSFEEALNEAKDLWVRLVEDPRNVPILTTKIEKIFGKRIRLSEALPEQYDLLELMIIEMRNM